MDKPRKQVKSKDSQRVQRLLDQCMNDEVSVIMIRRDKGRGSGLYIKEFYTAATLQAMLLIHLEEALSKQMSIQELILKLQE